MGSYILKRLLMLFPVLLGISLIVFGLMALIPGDPALAMLGPYATEENLQELREDLALDEPLPVQYLTWLGNIARGDFGTSISLNRPVIDEVLERFGATLLLAGAALLLCTLLGLAAGIVMAIRQFSWTDRLLSLAVLAGISTPSFWLGLLFVLIFSIHLNWFPASGMLPVVGDGGAGDLLRHLVLPAATLALVAAGVIARLMRGQMLEVLRQDYIRTARAKGVRESAVLFRHAFRNALVPMVPVIGIQSGFLIGGAVYVETIFQWPGIGRMLVQAIGTRDLLLVQGGVLVIAASYVLINLATDLIQHALDPRIKT
ncbi:MAG: ABC transporter permease [Opitutales bacterium]